MAEDQGELHSRATRRRRPPVIAENSAESARERTLRHDRLGDPGGIFEDVAEDGQEGALVGAVEIVERKRGFGSWPVGSWDGERMLRQGP